MKRILYFAFFTALILHVTGIFAQDLQEIMGQVTDMTRKAVYEPKYSFDIYLRLETTGKGEQQMKFDGYLSGDGSHAAILIPGMGEKTSVIIDSKNLSVLILSNTDGQKSGFAMAINPEALQKLSAGYRDEFDGKSFADLRTGKSKLILGYDCEEYVLKDEEGEARLWASEELGKKFKPILEGNRILFGGSLIQEYTDESGEEVRTMKITRLDLNANISIYPRDFQIMSAVQ